MKHKKLSVASHATDQNINVWLKEINQESKSAVSVDCVVFGYDEENLQVLCINSDMPPYQNQLSLIGDLVNTSETLDQAAARLVLNKTGLSNVYLEQVHTFSNINRHPLARVITVAYFTLLRIKDYNVHDADNRQLRWVPINEIENMAFDHKTILETCVEKLKKKVRHYPIGFQLLPKKFTLMQLQELYQIVLGVSLDKRNFRRKLNALNILVDLNENQLGVSHRPAKLYSFDYNKYESMLNNDDLRFEL